MLKISDLAPDHFDNNIQYYSIYPRDMKKIRAANQLIGECEAATLDIISPGMDNFALYQHGYFGRRIVHYKNADIDDEFKNFTGFLITDKEYLASYINIAMKIEDICNQMEQGIREGYRVEYCNNSVFWLSPIPYENIDWGC